MAESRTLKTSWRERRQSSARHLQNLYAITAGLALTLGVERLVDARDAARADFVGYLACLLVLLVTLVPFYHGTQRYLDDEYILVMRQSRLHHWDILLDFGALFFEACVLIAMATSIESARLMYGELALLLTIDIVWHLISTRIIDRDGDEDAWASRTWLWINTPVAALLLILVVSWPLTTHAMQAALLIAALVRTVLDYALVLDFYIGDKSAFRRIC